MYGTLYRMRPQQGQEQAVLSHLQRWAQERQPYVAGHIASYALQSEASPGEMVGIAVFDSQDSYAQNAADPAQDHWYQQLRSLLTTDPQWDDGEITAVLGEQRGL